MKNFKKNADNQIKLVNSFTSIKETMANNTVSALFTEQLRPQTLDQVLLVDRVRKQLQN